MKTNGRIRIWLAAAIAMFIGTEILSGEAQAQCERGDCRPESGSYDLQVLINGSPASSYWHRGQRYIEGCWGCRYTLRAYNRTGERVEVVMSIDGLDVIDGQVANYRTKRGYLVQPYSSLDVDGWRLNPNEVSAFHFTDKGDSYAARTGNARNVGVIGAAFFPERRRPVVYRPAPYPAREYGAGAGARYRSADEASAPKAEAPSAADGETAGRASPGTYGPRYEPRPRQNLGTGWGEYRSSNVVEVNFERANSSYPSQIISLYYDDRDGLIRRGVPVICHNCPPPSPWPVPYPLEDTRRYATPPY